MSHEHGTDAHRRRLSLWQVVLYGLARKGDLPEALGQINPRMQIPLLATSLATGVILALALLFPLELLAQYTAQGALRIFICTSAALIRLKSRESTVPTGVFLVPIWIPCVALLSNVVLLVASLLA